MWVDVAITMLGVWIPGVVFVCPLACLGILLLMGKLAFGQRMLLHTFNRAGAHRLRDVINGRRMLR